MIAKEGGEYQHPSGDGRSISPEHDKRDGGDHGSNLPHDAPLNPELDAAYEYVESVLWTSDFKDTYAWHGWGIREAFLAGITYAKEHNK